MSTTAGNPAALVQEMITAGHVSRAIQIAVRLGIPDLIAVGRRTTEQLAEATGTNSRALERLLRVLAVNELCALDERGTWQLTNLGHTLRSGSPTACHAAALYWGLDSIRAAWDRLDDSLRSGQAAFSHANGGSFFRYMQSSADDAKVFDEFMTATQRERAAWHADAIDCQDLGRVIDVGGGEGAFLIELVKRNPHLSGIVLDLPHAAARARRAVIREQLHHRISVAEGSFFEAIPHRADAYVLSAILHDWPDDQAVHILRVCRAAMTGDAVLLVIEQVIDPAEPTSRFSALLDLTMLVLLGGKERTREEFGALFAAADLELVAVSPTPTTFSIITARPV